MATYQDSIVAVGKLLQPKAGEPHRHELLKVRPNGTVKRIQKP